MKDSYFPRLRVLWRFARPHKLTLLLGLLLGLVTSSLGLATPLVVQWVLDSFRDGTTQLAGPTAVLLGLLVVGALVSWWQWVVLGTLAENVVYEARESMVRRFLRARVLPLLQRPTGDLVTRVTSDSVLLREAASSSVVGIINGVVMLVGTLVLMAVLDIVLMITTVTAVIVIALVFALLLPAIAKSQEQAQSALADLGGSLAGNLRAIKTVKVATAEDRQTAMLLGHAQRSRTASIRAVRREALLWSVAWSGVQAATILILVIGAWRVAQGQMSVSLLVAFLLYVIGLLDPVMSLSQEVTTLQNGIAAAGRIRQIDELEQEDSAANRAVPATPRTGAPMIEFDDVTARYSADGPPAVEGISLAIDTTGHTAIVGPSGAGKTTIFSLILGFLDPERGRLCIAGVPYAELGAHRVRERLAYVEQEAPTLPGTLRENLVFLRPDAAEPELHDILDRVGLGDLARDLPHGLDSDLSDTNVSGGQRQRIALARALLGDPAVLLLDEATAQVDGVTEAAIHDVIRERATKAAVVTIAHRLSTVIDADAIILVDRARIVDRGTHSELIARSPLYRDLVDSLSLHR